MQVILDHIARAVRPALRKYAETERALDAAHKSGDQVALEVARQDVLLAVRGAVDLLHHLADFVFKEPDPALPAYADVGAVRAALKRQCTYLRTAQSFDDVVLLNDIARAFKHHRPDHGTPTVAVSTAIVPVAGGWGTMRWGEGKYGGAEQVVVTKTDGDKRAVSSVLQNVFDAWMRLLGQPLLPVNQF